MASKTDRRPYIPTSQINGKNYMDWLSAGYINNIDLLVVGTYWLLESPYVGMPELVSHLFYNKIDYWWILCLANGIIMPMYDMYVGQNLIIPTQNSINMFLTVSGNSINNNTSNNVGVTVSIP